MRVLTFLALRVSQWLHIGYDLKPDGKVGSVDLRPVPTPIEAVLVGGAVVLSQTESLPAKGPVPGKSPGPGGRKQLWSDIVWILFL